MLLLGARQTGKTTLAQRLNPDLQLNFIRPEVRQRYERRPELLGAEIESRPILPRSKLPLVLLDEALHDGHGAAPHSHRRHFTARTFSASITHMPRP